MQFNRDIPAQQFLNLFGSNKVDETAERVKTYNIAKQTWPANLKISSCDSLATLIESIQLSINAELQSRTLNESAANQRIRNRYIDGYTQWQNEVKTMYASKQCEELKEDEDEKEFFDNQYSNLEKIKGLSEKTGNTTKYLIYGMLGIVVLVSGIIIFKKD